MRACCHRVVLASLVLAGSCYPAFAGPEDCAKLTTNAIRLACYDAIFGKPDVPADPAPDNRAAGEPGAEPARDAHKWELGTSTSKMTDQQNVFLTLDSDNDVSGPFGGGLGPARLLLRCMENTTAVMLVVNGHFLADIQGYGRVEYRLDKDKLSRISMSVSTDNKALGLWNGSRAIPFIKQLIGHDTLVMRVTPFNESPVTLTFDITGLSEVLPKLRETCRW